MNFLSTLRGWIYYLLLALSILPLTATLLVTKLFGVPLAWRYERVCRPWARFSIGLLDFVCGVRCEMIGMDRMPAAHEQVVVLAKHQSAWDPLWLAAHLNARACFLYKKSLHSIPVFGWAVRSMEMLAVDRSQGRSAFENFMEKGPDFLKRGWWICLFPEGTRVAPGERVRYKTGGARFACATGVPVLPIAHTAGNCWPKNSIGKRPGTIRVSVGPLIETKGRDPQEVTAEVEAWIEAEVEHLNRE